MTGRTLFHVTLLAALAAFYSITRLSLFIRGSRNLTATTTSAGPPPIGRWPAARRAWQTASIFVNTVYPQEVDYRRGLSLPEPWGRWSDANREPAVSILLREPLSGSLCLDVRFRAAPLQAGAPVMIRLGDRSVTVTPSDTEPRDYRIEAQLHRPAWNIHLEPSRPAPSSGWDPQTRNPRRIAIGLIRLQLRPGPCPG